MRRNTALTRIMASGVAAIMLCAGGTFTVNAAEEEPVKADVSVKAIQGLSDDFIGGMDVSSMLSLEESGVTFKNANGEVEDLFTLLKESGVNYVRLRVWNDPFTADGQGYGGGNVNADRALTMAKRATAAGLKVLVDFHYSDFWADPSKQQVPKAWKSFEGDADKTADTVYDYTKQTLTTFKQAGVDVGMVQVGNETTAKIAGISGWDGMSKVFSAGSKAIREVLPEAKVVIHFTNPEKAGTYATYAKQLSNHNVDYDVFASSYYPFWHGTTENLTSVLKNVASTYKKDVMVAETSWAYTLDDGDDDSNTVPSKVTADNLKKYDISPQGQADEIRAVAEAVNISATMMAMAKTTAWVCSTGSPHGCPWAPAARITPNWWIRGTSTVAAGPLKRPANTIPMTPACTGAAQVSITKLCSISMARRSPLCRRSSTFTPVPSPIMCSPR